MKESDLVVPVTRFMRRELGCSSIRKEVAVGLRRIDIVGLRGREIISMELKLRDWRGVLGQAWRNRICSHWTYVALPSKVAEEHIAIDEFARYGIGVCAVKGSQVSVTREPDPSPCLEPFIKPIMRKMRS